MNKTREDATSISDRPPANESTKTNLIDNSSQPINPTYTFAFTNHLPAYHVTQILLLHGWNYRKHPYRRDSHPEDRRNMNMAVFFGG